MHQTSHRSCSVHRTFVRAFTLPPPGHHAKLMSLTDGIVELRQKGASFGLIGELFSTVGVVVGADTIAGLFTEIIAELAAAGDFAGVV
jgi:hypothetical protein